MANVRYSLTAINGLAGDYRAQREAFMIACRAVRDRHGVFAFGVDGFDFRSGKSISDDLCYINAEPDSGRITVLFGANEEAASGLLKRLKRNRISSELRTEIIRGDPELASNSLGHNDRTKYYVSATIKNDVELDKFCELFENKRSGRNQ